MAQFLQRWSNALCVKSMMSRVGSQSDRAKSHLAQFHEDVWREATGELGATFEMLGGGIFKISIDNASTLVDAN
jgi:hypothetical protein